MWKKILAVLVAVLPYIFCQDVRLRWRVAEAKVTFGARAKLVCYSKTKPTIKDKHKKVIAPKPPKYELTVDGSDSTSYSTTLKITDLGYDDCGNYYCTADNKTVTMSLKLIVEIPDPKALFKLANGEKGVVAAVVKGCPRHEIRWQKRESSSSPYRLLVKLIAGQEPTGPQYDNKHMTIDPDNGYLIINKVTSADKGDYKVIHEGPVNELSKETKVETGDKPVIVKSPGPAYSVTKGEPLTLTCAFKVAPTSFSWEQRKGDGTKVKITSTTGRVKLSGTNLMITAADMEDQGFYSCSGKNEFGESTVSTMIQQVIVPPKITSNPVTVSKKKGEKVVLNCTASGTPKPEVEWKKDGVLLGDQKKNEGESIYTMNKLKSKDRGEYICTATNGAMKAGKKVDAVKKIDVIVLSAPTIDNGVSIADPKNVVMGKVTTLKCKADGYPLPVISFQKDKKNLTGAITDGKSTVQSITRSLAYVPKKQSDFGTIVCLASNPVGNDSKSIEITAINKPAQPIGLEIVTIKIVSISLKWKAPSDNGGDKITKYYIHITDVKSQKTSQKTSDLPSYTVKLLKRGTMYSFKVAAGNSAGIGAYSSAVKQKTHELSKPGKVPMPKLNKEKTKSSQISLSWDAPKDSGGAQSLSYKVIYCKWTANKVEVDNKCRHKVTKNTSITITGLEEKTKYKFEIIASNSAQSGDKSKAFEASTLTATPKVEPTPEPRKGGGGLSGGAIAGIVIAVILIVLIVIDLFCCFFNNCGFTHCCYETFCAGKSGGKYEAAKKEEKNSGKENDKDTDKDTAELKEIKVDTEPKSEEKNNTEKA